MHRKDNEMQIEKQAAINRRVGLWSEGKLPTPSQGKPVARVLNGVKLEPQVRGLGDRSSEFKSIVKTTEDRFISDTEFNRDGLKKLETLGLSIAQKTDDANPTYRRLWGIVQPEYNMLEPFTIYDSEPFVKQAINRKISLMFRNGFEFAGDQDPDIEYIQRRYEAMEYVMERTTESFFQQILFNLLLCSNCFLQKIRKESATIVSKKPGAKKDPVAGYLIIPAHMIFPYMDNGVPIHWRRFFDTGAPFEDIDLDDIIHLKWDVKPGHRYGTPRLIGVKDDIFALRRLEENVELLFINFLFPLFHVAVGSEENPAGFDGESGMSEVDMIHWQIQQMPKEGVFVTDERVKVAAVGSEGKVLDYSKLIEHYKARIYTGLGVSPADMGDAKNAGSRSTSENISQNLKDAIKNDLELFGGLIRMSQFKEFFQEATYSVSVQRAVARTWIYFHEIDLDNKIKFENHVIQQFLNNLVDEDEARKLMGRRAFKDAQRSKLNFALHTVKLVQETEKAKAKSAIEVAEAATEAQKELLPLQASTAEAQAKTQIKLGAHQTAHHESKAAATIEVLKAKTAHAKVAGVGAGRPQSATAKKSSPAAKSVQNKETPTNQHGSNLGPTKAKSSLEGLAAEMTDSVLHLIEGLKDNNGTVDHEKYQIKVGVALEDAVGRAEESVTSEEEKLYLDKVKKELDNLQTILQTTYDPDMISILISNALDVDREINIQVEPDTIV